MDKILLLKTYVDGGVNDTPFPDSENQIEIGSFRYNANRMGGAPTITATIMYPTCLDGEWSAGVYAEFNGEKYYLKQTPTSSYSNEDARYKHDVELVSERKILDDTYFYDAVVGTPQENDKPVTNDTKFNFYGNIFEFAKRMNASLQYTKLQKVNEDDSIEGYYVVIDDEIATEDKLVSFDNAVFSQALQESYNTFGIPFYFVGKEIHLGFTNNVISDILEYGVDDALLSITKQNSNFKVVNRASGKGSTDNIPYYYPNTAPKGEIKITASENNQAITSEDIEITDKEVFSQSQLHVDEVYTYRGSGVVSHSTHAEVLSTGTEYAFSENKATLSQVSTSKNNPERVEIEFVFNFDGHGDADIELNWELNIPKYYIYTQNEGGKNYNSSTHLALEVEDVFLSTNDNEYSKLSYTTKEEKIRYLTWCKVNKDYADMTKEGHTLRQTGVTIQMPNVLGEARVKVVSKLKTIGVFWESLVPAIANPSCDITFNCDVMTHITGGWKASNSDSTINMEACGVRFLKNPVYGDSFSWTIVEYIKTSDTLQPSIYRATKGKERFYNAINYPFDYVEGYELQYAEYVEGGKVHNDLYKKDDGTYMKFESPYVEGNPKEHVFSVDDLKPTIKEMTNDIFWQEEKEGETINVYQRIDMFSEFAYDEGDNDETDKDGKFLHPYFFAKLRKLNFNLFDCAIEQQPMTFSMTSGNCGACNFEIGVSEEEPQYNPVQVDENGNLVYDEDGRVLCGLEGFQGKVPMQPQQQDTINNEVWIALKKEESTYGILMPKAPKYEINEETGEKTLTEAGHRPKGCTWDEEKEVYLNDGDTFVILGIHLPEEYILSAERKLEKKILQYIAENNKEKFNFSISFSRIFLAENSTFLEQLNENARLTIKYNNLEYLLYVSSFSYNMSEGDVLPEIRVELDDTLTISQNALQNAINSVKSEIGQAVNAIDVVALGSLSFLRKDIEDIAQAPIGFSKGLFFGDNGNIHVNPDGSSKLTIDYLDVTRKATFTSLEIQEKTHVGGQFLITPASMICSYVEELEDAYRCYFQNEGEDGEEIFNTFAIDDQAVCQTYNAWGSKYYWRLVTGIGDNYIDLSKSDCAPESDIPSIGDKIIQLGNRTDITRQAAQVLSSYGENSPSFIMYNGINSFSLEGKNITGIVWNPATQEPQMYSYGNFFFGNRTKDENGEFVSDFITFQPNPENPEEKKLFINADVQFGGGSKGLSDLSEWKDTQSTISNIQDQIDGVVENYYLEGAPTIDNYPAIEWDTDVEKLNHVGDVYINIATEEQDPDNAGKAWRWCECGNEQVESRVYKTVNVLGWNPVTPVLPLDKEYVKMEVWSEGVMLFSTTEWNTGVSITILEDPTVLMRINTTSATSGIIQIYDSTGYFQDKECEIIFYYSSDGVRVTDPTSGSVKYLHWHPIADTDGVKALLEAYKAQSGVDELQYLKGTFAKGKTEIAGGVVLTEMVAVTDENNENIEAVINGSREFGFDDEHGKLLIAAGIDDIENPNGAKTRVYKDGTIVVDDKRAGKVIIDNDGFRYTGVKTDGTEYERMAMGYHCSGATIATYAPNAFFSYCVNTNLLSIGDSTNHAAWFDGDVKFQNGKVNVEDSDFVCNTVKPTTSYFEFLFDDSWSNPQISIPKGIVRGLRTATRVISSTGSSSSPNQLSNLDHEVLVNLSSGTCYIKVPSSPLDGQEYIVTTKGADIVLLSSTYNMYSLKANNASLENSFTISLRGVFRVKYFAGAAQWVFGWIDSY